MSQQGLEIRAVKCTLSGHHFRRADSSGCQSTHEVLLHETLHLFFLFLAFPSNTTGILKNMESRDGNFNSFLQMVGRNECICYGTKNIQLQCFCVLIPDL